MPPTDLQFGFQLTPTADHAVQMDLVRTAEECGLDLVGVQDHPYAPGLVDALPLIAVLAQRCERLRFFPDVASLPLRPPAMLATTIATLDRLSGGRMELGLGAGGYWTAIARMGVERLSGGEAVDALEEGLAIIRALWRDDDQPVTIEGRHHRVEDLRPGPPPAHPVRIWLGAQGPRMLRLTGQVADGWAAPIARYLPYEDWAGANATIDRAARDAGRDPRAVLRIAQLVGTVSDTVGSADAREGDDPVRGTPGQWVELLVRLATEQPFRAFVLWPEQECPAQVRRFAEQVVPRVRDRLRAVE